MAALLWEIFSTDLAFVGLDVSDQKELFEAMGGRLEELGYVRDSFIDAVAARERRFPTGLDLGDAAVAIPHTDPEHVNENAIAIANLIHPVPFRQMGSTEEEDCWVQVKLVIMLAISGGNYIDMLQRVIQSIQDPGVVKRLLGARRSEEFIEIVRKKEEGQ
ncbi:PTS sugar transporter subunit IIA [Coriobacteriales bacterium OH1046]|nr:PTS sugar transporter subunit IIA [Coriobacteriales bacterium OH1046]